MTFVIEPGVRKVVCPGCDSRLGYRGSDVRKKLIHSHCFHHIVDCPECKHEIVVEVETKPFERDSWG